MTSSTTLANLLTALRTFILALALCLSATSYATADTRIPIDTLTATAVLPTPPGVLRVNESFCDWHIVVWATGSGSIEYEVLASSIVVHDNGGIVDDLSTSTIFTLLCATTVQRGIETGYSAPRICPSTGTAVVLAPSCVARYGSGNNTAFTPCTPGIDRHYYTYCTSSGVATIVPTGVQSDGCSTGGCEPTWNDNGGGLN